MAVFSVFLGSGQMDCWLSIGTPTDPRDFGFRGEVVSGVSAGLLGPTVDGNHVVGLAILCLTCPGLLLWPAAQSEVNFLSWRQYCCRWQRWRALCCLQHERAWGPS